MSKNTGFDNPTPAEIARLRAIKKNRDDEQLSLQDERFLQDLSRRCDCIEARNVLAERLIPLLRSYVQKEMRSRDMKNDIAYGKGESWERPLPRDLEILSAAICGSEVERDRETGVLKPRGFMGATAIHNPNRGRIGTYVQKEVAGIVADENIEDIRRGEVGWRKGDSFHVYVSHSGPIPGGDGKTFSDLLMDRYDHGDNAEDLAATLEAAIASLDEAGRELFAARLVDEAYAKIGTRLQLTGSAMQKRMGRVEEALKAYVEQHADDPRPYWGFDYVRPPRHTHAEHWQAATTPVRGTPRIEWVQSTDGLRHFVTPRYSQRRREWVGSGDGGVVRLPRLDQHVGLGILGELLRQPDWHVSERCPCPLTDEQMLFASCERTYDKSTEHQGSQKLYYTDFVLPISQCSHKPVEGYRPELSHPGIDQGTAEALARDGMFGREVDLDYGYTEGAPAVTWDARRIKRQQMAAPDAEAEMTDRPHKGERSTKEPQRPRKPVVRKHYFEEGCMIIPAGARTKKCPRPTKLGCAKSASGGTVAIKLHKEEETGDYLYARLQRAGGNVAEVLRQHRLADPFSEPQELRIAA